jgi:alkylation response protein AidB-like acyl-CoA dehydrogenase
MAFRFDEDQAALADGVEDLLLGRAKGDYARAVAAGDADWHDLWESVSELGIPAMAVPEEAGGLGLGPIELVAVCERVGRHLGPAPIVATAGGFVPTAVAAGGEAAAAVTQVAEHGAAATLVYVDPTDPATLELRDGKLFATDVPVPDAARVDLLGFVVSGAGDGKGHAAAAAQAEAASLAIVAAADLKIAPVEGFDRTRPLALVSTADGAVAAVAPLPHGLAVVSIAFSTAAAELIGLAARMLELSVEHARERRQFGVPIGSFQGVKHRLADALVELERARSLTYRAAVACAGDDPAAALHASRMAKAAASDAATEVGRAAVQVHGGLGITVEADVSLFYLRARQASMQLGGRDAHYAALRH